MIFCPSLFDVWRTSRRVKAVMRRKAGNYNLKCYEAFGGLLLKLDRQIVLADGVC